MGLTPGEFWRLTPRTWGVLVEGYKERERRLDYRNGLLCAVIANCQRDPKKGRPFQPQDFMPIDRREQSVQEQVAVAKALTLAFGGEVRDGIADSTRSPLGGEDPGR